MKPVIQAHRAILEQWMAQTKDGFVFQTESDLAKPAKTHPPKSKQ